MTRPTRVSPRSRDPGNEVGAGVNCNLYCFFFFSLSLSFFSTLILILSTLKLPPYTNFVLRKYLCNMDVISPFILVLLNFLDCEQSVSLLL